MDTMIDAQRLSETFIDLLSVDSISREEAAVARNIAERLTSMGTHTFFDGAGEQVGGDTGNLIARFKGNTGVEPLLLSAHMDTVEPGRGIMPQVSNGVISSDGKTILGADDKSAVAIILEVLQCLREHSIAHGPLEVVFTICEEVGLLGARHLDYRQLTARCGYVLDTSNHQAIVTRAPAANQLKFSVFGKAAHAGGAPEKGINAIHLAAKAIAGLQTGRIDHETTCNIGLIRGGLATNIVPASAVVEGEVRSHDMAKLDHITQTMVAAFEQVVADYTAGNDFPKPRVVCDVLREFDALAVSEEHLTVKLAKTAAAGLNIDLASVASGGGSDANIFARNGITTPVLGTGMKDVHTVEESIRIEDMVQSAQLLLEIIRRHGCAPS